MTGLFKRRTNIFREGASTVSKLASVCLERNKEKGVLVHDLNTETRHDYVKDP
jgi:hypothetical protein